MRKKIVAGNWKMNKTLEEASTLASEVKGMVEDEVKSDTVVVLCTPSIFLMSVKKILGDGNRIFVGAQNCSEHESGAYTGEISAAMIKSGCSAIYDLRQSASASWRSLSASFVRPAAVYEADNVPMNGMLVK